jgi:hypothetical protein
MNSELIPLSTTSQLQPIRLYLVRDDTREDELRRIKNLVNEWLGLQYEPEPDPRAIRRKEQKLNSAIKGSSLSGMILNFAGLNIWVDDRTPDGVVEMQESINL